MANPVRKPPLRKVGPLEQAALDDYALANNLRSPSLIALTWEQVVKARQEEGVLTCACGVTYTPSQEHEICEW